MHISYLIKRKKVFFLKRKYLPIYAKLSNLTLTIKLIIDGFCLNGEQNYGDFSRTT